MMFSKSILTGMALLLATVVVDAQPEGYTVDPCAYITSAGTSEEINAKENLCVTYDGVDGSTCEQVSSDGNVPLWNVPPADGIDSGSIASQGCEAYWLCDNSNSMCSTCGDCNATQGSTVAPEGITLGADEGGDNSTETEPPMDGGMTDPPMDGAMTDPPTDSVTTTPGSATTAPSGASMLSSSLMAVVMAAGIAAMAM